MNKVKFLILSFLVLGLTLIVYQPAYSQERGRGLDQRKRLGLLFETLDQEVKEELIELKKEDREEFRAAAKEALEARKAELAEIREENPEEFQEIIAEAKERALERVKERRGGSVRGKIGKMVLFETLTDEQKTKIVALRNKYQEALDKAVKKRGEELKEIKADNPEQFEQIIEEAKDKVRARMKNQKKNHPQKFKQFQRMNPEYLGKKMEWLKEKDPQLYDYIVDKAEEGYSDSDESLE
jgi:F0F1-type ATP synthase membrane subunit b/b'